MTYKAFVSYSHAADGKLAPALQSALHRFAKPWYRLRAMRVFRDKTSLAMTPELWPSIEGALGQSEYFLLLASPTAAQSAWVQKEVAWWLKERTPKSLFLLLTDGELAWNKTSADFDWTKTTALPASLKGRYSGEPLWVDLRWAKSVDNLSLRHSQFRGAILDIAAPLLHRPKDELDGEDVRQHRRTKVIAWSAVLAIAVFAIAATWQAYVAHQRYLVALSRQLAAEALTRLADQPDRALLLAVAATTVRDTAEARSSLLTALEASPLKLVLNSDAGPVQSVAFGPDGALISGHASGELALWSLKNSAHPVASRFRGSEYPIKVVTFSPDGRMVASADDQGQIALWNAAGESKQPIRSFPEHDKAVNGLAFSRDGQWLVSVDQYSFAVARQTNGAQPPKLKQFIGALWSVDVHPMTSTVAIGGEKGIWFWQPDTDVTSPLTAEAGVPTKSVVFSPTGNLLASASKAGTIQLWDVHSDPPVLAGSFAAGEEPSALAFSPDGHRLAVGRGRSVSLWNTADLRQIGEPFAGHGDIVNTVSFSRDGSALVSGDASGQMLVWDLKRHQPFLKHDDEIWTVAVSADGQFVATGSADQTIRLTEVASGKSSTLKGVHYGGVSSVVFTSPDGHRLASVGHDNVIVDWKIGLEAEPRIVTKGVDFKLLAWFPASNALFAAGFGGVARIETATGRLTSFNGKYKSQIVGLTANRTGRLVASVDGDGRVFLWDAMTYQWLRELLKPGKPDGKSLAFAPDGRTLAVGYENGPIRLWDTELPDAPGKLVAKAGGDVKSLAFSSDGAWLASGDQQGGIRLWDPAGQQIGPELKGHANKNVTGLVFDPSELPSWLLSASDDSTAIMWDLDLDSWRRRACRRANRDLTVLERQHYLAGYESLAVCAFR